MANLLEFDKLLETPEGRGQFMSFLKSEYSDENLEFYLMVEHYKTMVMYQDRRIKALAEQIYSDYIRPDGARSVNLSGETQKSILLPIKKQQFSLSLFNAAQTEIYTLMKGDCFPRFINSKFANEFKQLHLEAPTMERKKKKARPFGSVAEYDSPHKVQRKVLKPEDQYEEVDSRRPLKEIVRDETPPQVPKRRESLGRGSNLPGQVRSEAPSLRSSLRPTFQPARAPLASVSETNLHENDAYSTLVNPSITTGPSTSSLPPMFEIKVLLPSHRLVTLISRDLPISSLLQELQRLHPEVKDVVEFRIVDFLSKQEISLSSFVRDLASDSILFIEKLVNFKIHFAQGLTLTLQSPSEKFIPSVLTSLFHSFGCNTVQHALNSLVTPNQQPKVTNKADEYANKTITLPPVCKVDTAKLFDGLGQFHSKEQIITKSIDISPQFYTSQSIPRREELFEPLPEVPIYAVPVKPKPRPVSMTFPTDFTLPTPSLTASHSVHSIPSSFPLYENTPKFLTSKHQTMKGTIEPLPEMSQRDEVMEINEDDFFDQIMKENYVKLKSVDLDSSSRSSIPTNLPSTYQAANLPLKPIANQVNRRESFHRANLAIVTGSPVRRSNSVPRRSSDSPFSSESVNKNPEKPLSQDIYRATRYVDQIVESPETIPKVSPFLMTNKTPSSIKTLSRFHKIN